jgi:nicotinamidase-related amidase
MAATPQRALIVIDLQNDYFPDGKFPLWNTEAVLAQVESAIARARAQGVPVILVQHIADAQRAAPFFAGTSGVELHPRILAAAPDAVVVTKAQADGFLNTTLEEKLAELGVEELLICGMMTQNCVTHTAISSGGEVPGCGAWRLLCVGEPDDPLIALKALAARVPVVDSANVL